MQSSIESDGSEEYFDAEDSTPHRLIKYEENAKNTQIPSQLRLFRIFC